MPSWTAGMYSLGIAPPTILFSISTPWPRFGATVTIAWPYWPRPPDWRMNLPSPSAGRVMVSRYAICGAQSVANDFQVQLAHAGDDELAGFFVGEAAKRRVLFREALQPFGHFFPVGLGLGFNGHRDDRFGEGRRLEQHFEVLVAKGVAGGDVPQADQRGDIAGVERIDVEAFVRLDHHHAADALAFAGARIVNDVALPQLTAVNAEEHQLADERIGPELEGERAEFSVVVGRHFDLFV